MTYLLKSIEWRLIAVALTILITYSVTGQIKTALTIGGYDFIIKTIGHAIWLKLRT